MTAAECLQDGKLQEAITAAQDVVKTKPGDIEARWFLIELLCFAGELERADQHLDTISNVNPERAPVVALFRQQIRAEKWRRECFESGRLPELIGEPATHLRAQLRALVSLRENDAEEAALAVTLAESSRPRVPGSCNGEAFDDIRDIDDTCASFLEVITNNGKYFWIGFDQITSIVFEKPGRNRDLLWRAAHLKVAEGPAGDVYLPALYVGSDRDADDAVRLGRNTRWDEVTDGLVRGVGQRVLLAGERPLAVHEIEHLEFRPQGAPSS